MRIAQELKKIQNNIKPNKTTNFVLPLTGYTKTDFGIYFVNAYLGDTHFQDWDTESPDIFILMKFHNSKVFKALEKKLEKDKYFKTSYSLFNNEYIMFVFTISPSFAPDFSKFISGKYSEFSDPAKIRLMRDRSENSPMPLILDKDSSLKLYWEEKLGVELSSNDEVWPILTRNDELFDRNEFKRLVNIVNTAD